MNDIKRVKFSKNKYKPPTLKQKRAAYHAFLKDDADWDWSSILRLLVFKLGRTREYIVRSDRHSDARETGREIAEVERRLKRVLADDYAWNLMRDHRKKYGSVELKFEPIEGSKCSTMLSVYPKAKTKKQQERARKEAREFYRQARELFEDDLRAALALMADKLTSWWD